MCLWTLNGVQYAAIITILDKNNLLKERKHCAKPPQAPKWEKILGDNINNIRRKISYICLIMKAQKENTELTKHQITIKKKLTHW